MTYSNTSRDNEECVIYWDYENAPIPCKADLSDVVEILIHEISQQLGYEAQIHEIRLYNNESRKRLPPKIRREIDKLNIYCPALFSRKSEHVDKKIIGDIGLHLVQWKGSKNAVIVLISGDADYASFLHEIKRNQSAKIILIPSLTFQPSTTINRSLLSSAHFVVDQFYKNRDSLIKCTESNPSDTHISNCTRYHFNDFNVYEEKKVDGDEYDSEEDPIISSGFAVNQILSEVLDYQQILQTELLIQQTLQKENKKKKIEVTVTEESITKWKKTKFSKKPKDPNRRKRPPNAFFLFMHDANERTVVKNEFPNKRSCEINKEMANKWKSLSDARKSVYIERHKQLKQEYENYMDEYKQSAECQQFAVMIARWKKEKKFFWKETQNIENKNEIEYVQLIHVQKMEQLQIL